MVAAAPFLAVHFRGTGTTGWIIFVVGFALLGAMTLAPTYTTSIIAGWAFGFRAGFTAVMLGTVSGALLCYLLARKLAAVRVAETFGQHPKWEIVRAALVEGGVLKTLWIVFLLRLSPVLPFGTTNVLMATTRVPLTLYVTGTLLGLAPRLGLVALAAAGADQLDFNQKQSWVILILGVMGTIVCIIFLAMIGREALKRATADAELSQK